MQLLLASNSTQHGGGYLDHLEPAIRALLGAARSVAFVPFALSDRAGYLEKARARFAELGVRLAGPEALPSAEAIFVGGGNTFRLLKELQERGLLELVR